MNKKKRWIVFCAAAVGALTILWAVLAAASGEACLECGSLDVTQIDENDEATCTEDWWVKYRCSACANTWTRTVQKAYGHDMSEGAVQKEATCTDTGVLQRICRNGCGFVLEEEIARSAHMLETHGAKAPSCEAPGQAMHYECTVCGALFADSAGRNALDAAELIVAPAGHKWDAAVTPPTCTSGGYTTRTCTVCGVSGGRVDETERISHDMTPEKGRPASCTESGTKDLFRCSMCAGVFMDEAGAVRADDSSAGIDPLGHDLRRTAGAQPSCTKPGTLEHWTCARCGKTFTDAAGTQETADAALPAAGHRLEHVPGKDATCETNGSAEHFQCTECAQLFSDDQAENPLTFDETRVGALGHDLKYYPKKQASEDEDGCKAHWKCERCGRLFADHDGRDERKPEEVYILATGHRLARVERRAATCTLDGVEAHYACTGCGAAFRDENGTQPVTAQALVIDAPGHMEEASASDPTCTEGGCTRYICSMCGNVRTAIPTEALGHQLVHVEEKKPTEREKGKRAHWKCLRCGALFADAAAESEYKDPAVLDLAPTGHTYADSITAPTCTEPGYTQHVCSGCGDRFTDTELPPKGHTLTFIPRIEPTEETNGTREHWLCEDCGRRFSDEDGRSELEDIALPAAGHTYTETIMPPTCTENGYTERTCSTCGDTVRDSFTDPTGHSLEFVPEVPATEEENGKRAHYECMVCAALFEDEEGTRPISDSEALTIPASGHSYEEHVVPADCDHPGCTEYTCTDCGRTYTDAETPALGHLMAYVPAQDPTLTRDGNIAYWKCERCGRLFADEQGEQEITAQSVVRARLEKDLGEASVETGDTADPYLYLAAAGSAAGAFLVALFLGMRRRRQ